MAISIKYKGDLCGHNGWVTQITINPEYPNMILSSSRDKTLIMWKLINIDETNCGVPYKRLYGHSHFISDVVISSNGYYALSGSWDKTLRLWDLVTGKTTRLFQDHSKDVLSVALSVDNRLIVSASRDKTIKLWNTIAKCKYTIQEDSHGHSDWVSCVRFLPNQGNNYTIVSAGWDRTVKVWHLTNRKLTNYFGHSGYLNTVAVSPDGSFCASGGKDMKAMLWDLNNGRHLHTLDHYGIITALCISPNGRWLCAALGPSIKIWDIESKELVKEVMGARYVSNNAYDVPPWCLSMAWSTDSQTLFAGYSDDIIRVYEFQDNS